MAVASITSEQLKATIELIEGLEEDKADIANNIKGVYGEAKALGYDTKIIRKVIAIRKRDAEDMRAERELLEMYLRAIEDGLPLFAPRQDAAA